LSVTPNIDSDISCYEYYGFLLIFSLAPRHIILQPGCLQRLFLFAIDTPHTPSTFIMLTNTCLPIVITKYACFPSPGKYARSNTRRHPSPRHHHHYAHEIMLHQAWEPPPIPRITPREPWEYIRDNQSPSHHANTTIDTFEDGHQKAI
jgi:hypothetical protein